MQEVAVVQRLQAEVAELQVAVGVERGAEALQVVLLQLLVEQLGLHAALDEGREVLGVTRAHFSLRDFLFEDLAADGVQQDAGGDLAVRRVLFDHRARSEDGRVVDLAHRHAVVQVLHRLRHDRLGAHRIAQVGAGRFDDVAQRHHIQRTRHAAVGDAQAQRTVRRFHRVMAAFLGALLAIQHVGARDVVLAAAHQREFDLILNVFNMEGAAVRAAAQQRADHALRELLDQFAHASRGRALTTVDGQECLGHGDGDLRRLERHHAAIATDHLVVGETRLRRERLCALCLAEGLASGCALVPGRHVIGGLHVQSSWSWKCAKSIRGLVRTLRRRERKRWGAGKRPAEPGGGMRQR
jgi:hypothetical protein